MEAPDPDEPVGEVSEGQDAKNDVSEDSDSGEVIIELDQNQIASPSDSEEDGELHTSLEKSDVLYDRTAESEYFDAVSDLDDMPEDEAKPSEEPMANLETDPIVELAAETESGEINQGGEVAQESVCLPDQPQGQTSAQISPETVALQAAGENITFENETSVPDSCTEAPSETTGEGDSKALQLEQDVSVAKDDSSTEKPLSPERDPSSSFKEKLSIKEPTNTPVVDVSILKDSATSQEIVSSATDVPEAADSDTATDKETPAVVTSAADLTTGADDMSDVSSEGEAPLSSIVDDDDEDKPSVEKLFQEAAHQAEALAPLGAEPVSEPESGEDMGSDESCPASPGYDSPAIMTSSSTLSRGRGDYGNVRSRITPTKSDSSILLDSAPAVRPAERLSLDAAIPTVSSISGSKLDLSASLDMENISDDENIGEDNESDTSGEIEDEPDARKVEEPVTSSTNLPEEEVPKDMSPGEKTINGERLRRPIMIASLGDKQQVQTHFNEEQVELDYEDVDGDGEVDGNDGEIKPEDEEEKEEGEDSDRDEGELDDDDDCEEGEIKEPGGMKKPFTKATCRFFLRGACTWGLNCRFLHPGVNDKGNYQMIELPGQRWNGPPGLLGPAPWGSEPQEEAIDLPPPPEVPPAESAWERGLRYAKEQMKKASQRKEQESNFEEKRLNLSVDEEREMNKENERRMVVHPIPKDPYYDQAAYDEEEYYKPPGINPWQTGRYENFEVRYNREMSYSPYRINREKEYYPPPPERYPRHFSPPVDKFGRHPREDERPEPPYRNNRMEDVRARTPPPPAEAAAGGAPSFPSRRPADEWHDPWRRSKSPKANRRGRSRSRSRRGRRSLSDSTFSSNSRSRSRSSGSHSSRSFSRSSISSRSRSRSPEPAPPGVERGGAERGMERGGMERSGMDRGGMERGGATERGGMDRGGMERGDRGDRNDRNYGGPQGRYMDGPRSAVSVRGRGGGGGGGAGGGHWRNQDGRPGYHNNRNNNYNNNRGGGGSGPQRSQQPHHHHHRQRPSTGQQDQPQERSFPPGYGYNRPQQGRARPQERRIPVDAMRPKIKAHSASSSGSSRSRSHSGSRSGSSSSFSRSRSGSARSRSASSASRSRSRSASSISSRTSSSSTHSSGSADSDNLYRDLGGPSPKKKTVKEKDKDMAPGSKAPRQPGQGRAPGAERKRRADQMAHRPGGPPLPPGAPSADRPGRPPRPEGRPERPPMDRPDQPNRVGHPNRPDRPNKPDRPDRAERPDRPMRPDRQERPDRAERLDRADRPDRLERMDRAERLDRPERPGDRAERPDRPGERPDRPERMGDRPERMDRMDRGDREREEMRQDRPDRVERERAMVVGRPPREQSSRPPPPSQSKAKDPMKMMGLKSNIKLSLVSKQPSDKPGSALPSSPLKRRPTEAGDGPPSKRPAMPTSPVKMPSEKAAKPSAGRERAKSPSERQPRSATTATNPASLPLAAAAGSIPLPPASPTKALPPAAPSKPRPPSSKTTHPHPPAQAGSKPAAVPAPVPPPAGVPPPAPAGVSPASAQAAAAKVKKSTTSRREELLKQLKAVEDAIARKKAKMQ